MVCVSEATVLKLKWVLLALSICILGLGILMIAYSGLVLSKVSSGVYEFNDFKSLFA